MFHPLLFWKKKFKNLSFIIDTFILIDWEQFSN